MAPFYSPSLAHRCVVISSKINHLRVNLPSWREAHYDTGGYKGPEPYHPAGKLLWQFKGFRKSLNSAHLLGLFILKPRWAVRTADRLLQTSHVAWKRLRLVTLFGRSSDQWNCLLQALQLLQHPPACWAACQLGSALPTSSLFWVIAQTGVGVCGYSGLWVISASVSSPSPIFL